MPQGKPKVEGDKRAASNVADGRIVAAAGPAAAEAARASPQTTQMARTQA